MLRSLTFVVALTFVPLGFAFGQDAALPTLPQVPPSPITGSLPQSSNPLTVPTLPEPPALPTSPLRPITPAPPSPNEAAPLVPALPDENDPLGSSLVPFRPAPQEPINRSFIAPTEAELVLRVAFFMASPNVTGQRRAPASFTPVAPWRFPRVESAGLQSSGGITFEFGYQFTIIPIAVVGRVSSFGEEQEIIYQNYDPLYNAYQNDPVVQRLQRSTNNGGRSSVDALDEGGVRVLPGWDDIFGSSLVKNRLTVTSLDLVAESPSFNVGWTSYRFWGGVRQTWFFLDDSTKGRGIEQIGSTSFEGWGPLLGGKANFGFSPANDIGIYTQVEGALLTGTTTQIFSEAFSYPYPALFTYAKERENRVVPNLNYEIGIYGYAGATRAIFFQIAYQLNQWIDVGKIGNSNVSLHTHGALLRFGLNY